MPADKQSAASKPSLFHTLFVEYGAGARFISAVTEHKLWNTAAWILIGVGIVGWGVFVWWCGKYAG